MTLYVIRSVAYSLLYTYKLNHKSVNIDIKSCSLVTFRFMELILFKDSSRPSSLSLDQNGTSNFSSQNGGINSNTITPTRSTTDLPNTVGNTARRDNGALLYEEIRHRRPSSECQYSQQRRQQWESNYKEAAIFLEEGENNDKFSHHPRSYDHLPAYLLVHNKWFNIVDLGAALVLLSLGYVEGRDHVPVQVHGSIELCKFEQHSVIISVLYSHTFLAKIS